MKDKETALKILVPLMYCGFYYTISINHNLRNRLWAFISVLPGLIALLLIILILIEYAKKSKSK